MAYGKGIFVATGPTGLFASPDAARWTQTLGFSTPASVAGVLGYGGGLFVAADQSGSVWTSPDGLAWTHHTSTIGLSQIRDVAYGDSYFVAVGDGVSTSSNGIVWTKRNAPFRLNAITFAAHSFLAVGDDGLVVESGQLASVTASPRFQSILFPAGGPVQLGIEATAGTLLTIEASADLSSWTPLTNARTSTGVLEVVDKEAPSLPLRFYRVRQEAH